MILRAFVFLSVVLLGSDVATAATSQPVLVPFRPPLEWSNSGAGVVFSHLQVLNWNADDGSMLSILGLPGNVNQKVSGSSYEGQIVSTETKEVCGETASRTSLTIGDPARLEIVQSQVADGKTYFVRYYRSATAAADLGILAFLDTFCGSKTLADAKPPINWHDDESTVIGLWIDTSASFKQALDAGVSQTHTLTMVMKGLGDQEQLRLISFAPDTTLDHLSQLALHQAIPNREPTIVSSTKTTRCGYDVRELVGTATAETTYGQYIRSARASGQPLPPQLADAGVVKGPETEQVEIRVEVTQSPTVAYALIYTHGASQPPSPAALASLQTLCAQ